MIEINGLSFGYDGSAPLFAEFNWQVEKGESWAIIGPSGCGKTTLLYLLAGLRKPRAGSLRILGESVTQPRPSTGLILQDFGLLPWASARENVELGLKIRRLPAAQRRATVDDWLKRLDIENVANRYPNQMSGGQRQRVAIARTLAIEPDILLMDEPFSSLDALTRESLQNLIVELGIEGTLTSVLVTHNIEEAVFLGRRILVLHAPPIGTARIVDNPQAGELGYRHQPAFYAKCDEIRQAVEEVQYVAAR
jgi:NitT/TauT family transport system ATP-binding protein